MHPTKQQGKIEIDGRKLDVVCSLFGDRVFLFVSELQKMGTIVSSIQWIRRLHILL